MLDNEPNAEVNGLGGDTTTEETQPPAPRRRAASRPAGPPPEEPDSVPEVVSAPAPRAASDTSPEPSPAGAAVPAAESAEAAAEMKEMAPKRAIRRKAATTDGVATTARRSRAKKAAEPVAEPVETGIAGAEPAAVQEPFAEPAPQEAPAAPVKRTRTRKKAVVREAPAEAEKVADNVPTAVAEEVEAELLLEMPADEPLDDEPAGEDVVEEVAEGRRPGLFADPFGLVAQERSEVPSVTFQAPAAVFQPLFQAPDPQRATQPAARPAPVQPPAPQPEPEPAVAKAEIAEEPEDDDTDGEDDDAGGRRRRRRRGGRGRGKTRDLDESEETEAEPEEEDRPEAEQDDDSESGSSRRRRRRRRRGTDETGEVPDDPPNTVVRIRAPRAGRSTSVDEVQSVRGSTRLEAKKQRRREGRELGRRRPPIITESEFLARRESVERVMVVRRTGGRTQIAVLEDGVLVEHYVNREASQSYVGNVYLGKVQNVLPSMEAAFVDIGKGRNAVLYAGEVNFDTAGLEGQPKRIEVALKSGQSVLVQVTKDPMGHKGARLTSQISLPGRYLVYVPDGSMTGISRKLPDKERTRLKSILKKVMPENAGVIVRTAAEGASEDELSRDVARLSAQWENIQRKAKSASAPELLSSEPDLTVRVVRDVFNEDFASLVVAGDEVWETVDEYVRYVAPHLAGRLSRWEEGGDVFAAYRIDEQIAKAMERKVWLPSGGSLVIDRTEAMTVVDVNTGKFTGQGGNLEETVTRNNLEAAEEIVRQLRLRDIGGIIVIDFIDMVLENNRDLVLRRLLECLARDRTKHQVAEVTSLGLVQMTRKRVGQGLLEAFSTVCECCNGRGLHVSAEPVEGKPEPRGTQGKMAVEKAVAEKLGKDGSQAVAAGDQSGRDTVTDALDGVQNEDGQAAQASGRGRRRSRKARPAE
ncbi:Rne/Rng family ribonuclease [Streptosporangium sp. NBC_01755]|uniref:Rne/Rng family ribonuclease n=1 Tax=unclassified Streptosporangium TaxID=2632669 RepID=UPI002DD99743|nr:MULTISPECIES: Rne/Rng family ribonuclease [unclassified Streptosporangium]WSA27069.1 Rne/Rng family ribonuclease [Streptosporangium sp. NBC_01810]WSD01373.1 Rne/Rng family ribonuclease [Streptosporangium sp. NBC_01755]